MYTLLSRRACVYIYVYTRVSFVNNLQLGYMTHSTSCRPHPRALTKHTGLIVVLMCSELMELILVLPLTKWITHGFCSSAGLEQLPLYCWPI